MQLELFEFEDQPWFPAFLRDYQTDFLGFIAARTAMYMPAKKVLSELDGGSPSTIVDLASGAGQPALFSTFHLRKKGWNLLLTDRFPNVNALEITSSSAQVEYRNKAVDALQDRLPEGQLYTMFNAFHHFSLTEKLKIGHNVFNHQSKLMVFEPLQPNPIVFIKVLLATTVGLLLAAPFIKPFSVMRLLFTYIIPVGIFVTCWDGLVSVMKALSHRDLKKFKAAAMREGLNVSYAHLPSNFARITFIKIG